MAISFITLLAYKVISPFEHRQASVITRRRSMAITCHSAHVIPVVAFCLREKD